MAGVRRALMGRDNSELSRWDLRLQADGGRDGADVAGN